MGTDPAAYTNTIQSGGTVPVGMRAGADQAAVTTTAATTTNPFGFSTSTQANAIVTLINELRASCIAAGIIKGSA